MKRIETKLLGRIRQNSPEKARRVANFTPVIDIAIIKRAESRAVKDGFPYFRDLVLVLLALYGNGSLSQKLDRDMPGIIQEWIANAARGGGHPIKRSKRNLKIRRDVYDRAVKRWAADSSGRTATSMLAFLLESYADGEIEFALRRGHTE